MELQAKVAKDAVKAKAQMKLDSKLREHFKQFSSIEEWKNENLGKFKLL